MIEDLIDTSHWVRRGLTLLETPFQELQPLLDTTEKELFELMEFVGKFSVAGLDIGQIRTSLYLPFGGPDLWNRKVNLYTREIEYLNDRHCGKGEAVPDWEWTLSGLHRPEQATRRAVVGHEPNPPLVSPGEVAPK